MSDTKRAHHTGQKCITIWAPRDLAAELEAHLSAQVAGMSGAKASRQGWLLDLIRRELAAVRAAIATERDRSTGSTNP